ncbi:hypothetical protein QVD17_18018 [Tagetes erecta]|uniref:Uncharacterized protein n=1 Tax=Tagetes erecta TaxID=13708 RepID=A0AAD8NVP8_TARER|nr:hypothetical protein QVD17_18018 [Tagetes erecta]
MRLHIYAITSHLPSLISPPYRILATRSLSKIIIIFLKYKQTTLKLQTFSHIPIILTLFQLTILYYTHNLTS